MSFSEYWYIYYALALRFSCQLIFCEGLFCVKLRRRKCFVLRVTLSVLTYMLLNFGIFLLFMQVPTSILNLQIPYFILNWGLTLPSLFVCFEVKWKEIIFVGIGGYALQHMGYSISMFIRHFITYGFGIFAENMLFEVLPFIVVGGAAFFGLIRPNQSRGELRARDVRFILLAAVLVASSVVLSSFSAIYYNNAEAQIISRLICRPYAVICCLLTLLVMFGFMKHNKLEHDNELMELLLHLEKDQHRIEKENIDIINMKCHDLKHQIGALRQIDNYEERNEAITEIERA